MRIPALTVAAALASTSYMGTNNNGGSSSGEPSTSSIGIGGPAFGVSAFVIPPSSATATRRSRVRPASSQTSRGISSSEQYLNSLSPVPTTTGPLHMSTAAPPEKPPTDDGLVPLPEMDKDGLYNIENAEQHK